MTLSQYIGESRTHRVKLTFLGQPFDPEGWTLLFSAKYNPKQDDDTQSIFQKTSGAGITTETEGGQFIAVVTTVPQDTDGQLSLFAYYDIKARKNDTGETRIVGIGRLELKQAITLGNSPATPIHTTEPLSPDHALVLMAESVAATAADRLATAADASAASTSAMEAGSQATIATTKAGEALSSANAASVSAGEAAAHVETAAGSVNAAQIAQQGAVYAAGLAESSASAAVGSASAANSSAISAASSASAANSSAIASASSAGTASSAASSASSASANAIEAANTAASLVVTATNAANSASASKSAAATSASNAGVAATAAQTAASDAAADALATAADRVQTGQDRVATAADAQATAADAQATAADRVQTGQDRVATTADAQATGADRIATGQDRAATGQDRIATGADAQATAADRVQTGQDRVATGQDRVATGQDRVQTGLDHIAADASAVAAAASAVTALNAISSQFKGGLAGSAVPNTSAAAGDTYRITSAGTSQGKTWAIGDAAIYNGTSGSWTQLSGALPLATSTTAGVVQLATAEEVRTGTDTAKAVTSAALAAINPRSPSDYLWSNSMSGCAQVQTPGPRGNLAGAPLASWVGWVEVPAIDSWVGNTGIAIISNTASPALSVTTQNTLYITLNPGTVYGLGVTQVGTTGNARARYTGTFMSLYAGRRVFLEVRLSNGAGDPVVRVNGNLLTTGWVTANSGTPPQWLDPAMQSSIHTTGLLWPVGVPPIGCWLNAHLTDAESESWRITGRPPAWAALGGGYGEFTFENSVLPGVGNEVSSLFDLTRFGAIPQAIYDLVANPDSLPTLPVAGATKAVKATPSSLLGYTWNTTQVGGRRVQVRFWYYVPAGQPDLQFTGNGQALEGLQITGSLTVKDAWTEIEFTIRSHYGATTGTALLRSTGTFYLARCRHQVFSALSLPVVQPINALGDGTVLGDNPARLVGIQPVTTRKDWQITARTSTSGNEQLLGGSILDPSRDVLDSIEQTPETGTPTTIVGAFSSGAQYKGSSALAAGINTPALVTRKTASANVWVGSTTADPIRTTLTGHSR